MTKETFTWIAFDKEGRPYALCTDDISDGFRPNMTNGERTKQINSWRRDVARFVSDAIKLGNEVRKVSSNDMAPIYEALKQRAQAAIDRAKEQPALGVGGRR